MSQIPVLRRIPAPAHIPRFAVPLSAASRDALDAWDNVGVTDSVFDFKISRLAYFAVLAVVLLVVLLMGGSMWFAIAFVVPVALVWWIHRLHTRADAEGITATGASGVTSLSWDDVKGLQFPKWSSVRAVTTDGREVRLPAVRFEDVPALSAASGGRLPDPFASEREARAAADAATEDALD
ncbi:PH domain-containing protein [Gordonia zhaorongruii]|uniref:PH domain-containing protein n=1 Tax=Gordonia zhaorongruii TaxID=2597659 RepID=UPI001FD3A74C|nr:PH domain-containing protein [Gordonia zhaorongruii]